MRISFYSPLPPARSGIADYSAALLAELGKLCPVEVRTDASAPLPDSLPLYQLGNNPFHEAAYRAALEYPGVAVLHEANLHHLIAEITIKRNRWDDYLAEVAYDGGGQALAYAQRVRALEVGPDYEGVPMLRRVLERSRGVIVHSRCVAAEVRAAGYTGPVRVIPHGAWLPELNPAQRLAYRTRLGLDEATPLAGIFGFLKPYKRIAESLRAFRRLLRLEPNARLVLVGEVHPDLPLADLLDRLGLRHAVRVTGFTPIEDFNGYLAACDVVLNLRYPTVGESSGTLLRALGFAKPVLVSNLGSFAEYPDHICLKVPVDSSEEDHIFEYLNLLVSRPTIARELGTRARAWVASECAWDIIAARYLEFLNRVHNHTAALDDEPVPPPPTATSPEPPPSPPAQDHEPQPPASSAEPAPPVPGVYLKTWAADEQAASYLDTHLARLERTLAITPPGTSEDRILEMGAYLQITPALKTRLGYGEVRGCYYGPAGHTDLRTARSQDGETFEVAVDLFDAEKDPFPYPDEHFTTVLCCELIEHLFADPMHMMSEIHRILKPGGHLVLTTPNIGSLRAIAAILTGYHPGFFPAYIKPPEPGKEPDARHNREYVPREIHQLLTDAGFEVTLLETGPFRDEPHPELAWVRHLLDRYLLSTDLRGEDIYAVGRKTGPVKARYPDWLYS